MIVDVSSNPTPGNDFLHLNHVQYALKYLGYFRHFGQSRIFLIYVFQE